MKAEFEIGTKTRAVGNVQRLQDGYSYDIPKGNTGEIVGYYHNLKGDKEVKYDIEFNLDGNIVTLTYGENEIRNYFMVIVKL